MQRVDTSRFGAIQVEERQVVRMPRGMLGFPESKRFVIIQHRDKSPFRWYQSLDDPALAFVIIDPALIKPDYRPDSCPEMQAAADEMGWNIKASSSGVQLYVVVNIPGGSPEKTTVNLIGPILIDWSSGEAVQLVISNSSFSCKHPLVPDRTG